MRKVILAFRVDRGPDHRPWAHIAAEAGNRLLWRGDSVSDRGNARLFDTSHNIANFASLKRFGWRFFG
jgi:hypothetical protein